MQEEQPFFANPCQHVNCDVAAAIACYVPGSETPDAWYCRTHAPIHGFCAGCGELHGGEDDFENSQDGLCDLCSSEREYTLAREQQAITRDGEWL